MPLTNINENIIGWWINRQSLFPSLFKIAMQYLCIPATSATSERIFYNGWANFKSKKN